MVVGNWEAWEPYAGKGYETCEQVFAAGEEKPTYVIWTRHCAQSRLTAEAQLAKNASPFCEGQWLKVILITFLIFV